MNRNTKIIIAVIILLLGAGGVYIASKKQSPTADQIIQNESSDVDSIPDEPTVKIDEGVKTSVLTPSNKTSPQPSTPSISLIKYTGEFFPFEFSYLASFRPTKDTPVNTKDNESRSYNFNRLAESGGVAGYVSFYVSRDNDDKYKELTKTYPDKYSVVEINGYKFYKHVEIGGSTGNELRVEYVTFKDGVEYRFALVAVNGDRKVLDIKFYQNELDIMNIIIRSLKIN